MLNPDLDTCFWERTSMVLTCQNCNIELSFLYHIVFYLGFHFAVEGRRTNVDAQCANVDS